MDAELTTRRAGPGVTLDHALAAVRQVLANRGDPADGVTGESALAQLRFDSLDLAEVLILLEEHAGGELDAASAGPLLAVRDLTRLVPRAEP